jgi:uncharacterized protein
MSIKSDKNTVVLYHANCLDGFGAAYAAWKHLGDEADYFPVQYGDELDVKALKDKIVFIVDFSYKCEQLFELVTVAKIVTVLDHHKTALPELEAIKESYFKNKHLTCKFHYVFDLDTSGAVITWEYFHNKAAPKVLKHIQDRDLWQFELADTKEICAALADESVVARDFAAWDTIITSSGSAIRDLAYVGSKLLANFNSRCAKLMWNSYPCRIECTLTEGLAINAPPEYASELGNLLAKESGTYGAVWFYRGGGKYQVSLRSIGDFDVSAIAKQYGGGGHKNAAGFVIDKAAGYKLRLILEDLSYKD